MTNYEEFRKTILESKIDGVSMNRLHDAIDFNELHCGQEERELGRVVILVGLAILDCLRRQQ